MQLRRTVTKGERGGGLLGGGGVCVCVAARDPKRFCNLILSYMFFTRLAVFAFSFFIQGRGRKRLQITKGDATMRKD